MHVVIEFTDQERAAAFERYLKSDQAGRSREGTGRTVDQVALDLLATSIDHDDWFRAEVEKGPAAAREGRLIEHDDVAARMDRRYRG